MKFIPYNILQTAVPTATQGQWPCLISEECCAAAGAGTCCPSGKCCSIQQGACIDANDCPSGTTFNSSNCSCDSNGVPQGFGACCDVNTGCTLTTQTGCNLGVWYAGQPCGSPPCN